MKRADFIKIVLNTANQIYIENNVINPGAATAHAALESNYGDSILATRAMNIFGIKAGLDWTGSTITLPTIEYIDGKRVEIKAVFKRYPSYLSCIRDYADIINNNYPYARDNHTNPYEFLRGLFITGPLHWATDPEILDKIWTILINHDLYIALPRRIGEYELLVINDYQRSWTWKLLYQALLGRPLVIRQPLKVSETALREHDKYKLDVSFRQGGN